MEQQRAALVKEKDEGTEVCWCYGPGVVPCLPITYEQELAARLQASAEVEEQHKQSLQVCPRAAVVMCACPTLWSRHTHTEY